MNPEVWLGEHCLVIYGRAKVRCLMANMGVALERGIDTVLMDPESGAWLVAIASEREAEAREELRVNFGIEV